MSKRTHLTRPATLRTARLHVYQCGFPRQNWQRQPRQNWQCQPSFFLPLIRGTEGVSASVPSVLARTMKKMSKRTHFVSRATDWGGEVFSGVAHDLAPKGWRTKPFYQARNATERSASTLPEPAPTTNLAMPALFLPPPDKGDWGGFCVCSVRSCPFWLVWPDGKNLNWRNEARSGQTPWQTFGYRGKIMPRQSVGRNPLILSLPKDLPDRVRRQTKGSTNCAWKTMKRTHFAALGAGSNAPLRTAQKPLAEPVPTTNLAMPALRTVRLHFYRYGFPR